MNFIAPSSHLIARHRTGRPLEGSKIGANRDAGKSANVVGGWTGLAVNAYFIGKKSPPNQAEMVRVRAMVTGAGLRRILGMAAAERLP
jgi:hypothetical protein